MRPPSDDQTIDDALAALLRDERPRPSDEFAHRLDDRMRAPRRRMPPMRRLILPGLAATAGALVLGVIASSVISPGQEDTVSVDRAPLAQQEDDSAAAGRSSAAQPRTAQNESGGDAMTVPGPEPVPPTQPPSDDVAPGERTRSVERAATLSLGAPADELEDVSDGVIRATDAAGGIVVSSDVTTDDDDSGSASFELRIPVNKLDAALADLSELAHVRSRTQESEDVTKAVVDARERLEDAQGERRALLRALGRADTAAEASSIRTRLRLVAGEIAAARAARRDLAQRTSYSRVDVTIGADRDTDGAWTPGDALDDAVSVLETIAGVLLVALAVLLPVGLIAAPAVFAARRARRRRREQALDAV